MSSQEWFGQPQAVCCAEETFVHESAYVDEPCRIGHATQVMHFCRIAAHSMVGAHCEIGPNVSIASGVLIGNDVRVFNNTLLNSGVILEDHVTCGPSTVVIPLKYVRGEAGNVSTIHPTLVKRGAHIGANTTIATGMTIGQYAFVEAGSVIDSNIPDFALVYGNPVQIAGWRCECGQMLTFLLGKTTACSRCNRKYARRSETEIVQLTSEGARHDSHIQSRSAIRSPESFH